MTLGSPGTGVRHAPSFRLVNAHLLVGQAGFLFCTGSLVLRAGALEGHYFQPALLGLAHACALLWLLPVALGALHQLVPVVFEVPLRSERLAWAALVLYLVGAAGLVGHLWTYATHWGLPLSAGLVAGAVLLYAGNLLATVARARRVDLTGAHVIAALLWLAAAALLGLALAWNLWRPFLWRDHLDILCAHAHAAGMGFFGLLIMGVSYTLFEMFLVAHGAARTLGRAAFAAANAGLVLLIVNELFRPLPALRAAAAGGLVLAVLAYVGQVAAIVRRRLRRRLDAPWWQSLASVGWLLVAAALAGAQFVAGVDREVHQRLALAYGVAALPGFAGSMIVGQLYKIVPFLVWLRRFSPLLGLKEVPAAASLLPARLPAWQWAGMQVALVWIELSVLLGAPWLVPWGAALLLASALAFAGTLAHVYRRRP